MRILFVDDDSLLGSSMRAFFRGHPGCDIDIAKDGFEAIRRFDESEYAATILDWNLPGDGPSGLDVCRTLRLRSTTVGIMFLTVRDSLEDRLSAFEAGADDYVTKPFEPRELLARTMALGRRSKQASGVRPLKGLNVVQLGESVSLDCGASVVTGPQGTVRLTKTELQLLLRLIDAGRAGTSTNSLAANVLSRHDEGGRNLVHRHLSNLREKLESVGVTEPIQRGPTGYLMRSRAGGG
jgi:OmpR-family two-component system manganese-sensing response regulator